MPIDPRIALGVQPLQMPLPDPNQGMNALARMMQVQGAMSQNELARYSIDKARRQDAESNAIADLVRSGVDPMTPEGQAKLYGAAPLSAESFLKGRLETKNLQSQITEREAKSKTEAFQRAEKGYKLFQQTVGAHFTNPAATPQSVAESVQGLVSGGMMDEGVATKLLSGLPQDPAQLKPYLRQVLTSQMTPEQMLTVFAPKPSEVSNGQQKFFRDTNPNSPTYGQVTAGAPVQMQMTPGEVASDKRAGAQLTETKRHNTQMEGFRSTEVGNQQGQRTQQGVIELRKEFNALPEVKNYREVLPIIQSVQRAPDTPAGDIDLIYGVGKVMDPNSVVREGEMSLVIKSGSPAQRLQGYLNFMKGNGRLTPSQRQELLTIMQSRVEGLRTNYESARRTFETAADRGGFPKDQIFIDNPTPTAVVDLHNLPAGSRASGGKVVDFGSLK